MPHMMCWKEPNTLAQAFSTRRTHSPPPAGRREPQPQPRAKGDRWSKVTRTRGRARVTTQGGRGERCAAAGGRFARPLRRPLARAFGVGEDRPCKAFVLAFPGVAGKIIVEQHLPPVAPDAEAHGIEAEVGTALGAVDEGDDARLLLCDLQEEPPAREELSGVRGRALHALPCA